MAGYLGSVPVPQATQHRETFTATAGQTSFATAGYTPQFVDVYLNGVHLSPADVTATNGSDVVLTACLVNDIVDVVSYTPFEIADQTFTGTTTVSTLEVNATDNVRLRFLDGGTFKAGVEVATTAGDMVATSADGDLAIRSQGDAVFSADGNVEKFRLNSTGAIFNDTSIDLDFRVESNGNANTFFIDGGDDIVSIGNDSPRGTAFYHGGQSARLQMEGLSFKEASFAQVINSTSNYSSHILARSRGTALDAVTVLQANDIVGEVIFQGADGTNFIQGAAVTAKVEAGVGANDMPMSLIFSTNAGGTGTTEHLRLDSAGRLSLGAAAVQNNSDNTGVNSFQLGFSILSHFDIDAAGTMKLANNQFVNGGANKACLTGASTDYIQFGGVHAFRTAPSVSGGASCTNTERFRIALNGDLTGTDTSIASNSDERLKENVADYTYDVAKFKQYEPKTFDWKNADAHNGRTGNRGFLAQAVNAIDSNWIGEATVSEDSPDYDIISNNVSLTSKLGDKDAMYISVIQQLITRIEALEG